VIYLDYSRMACMLGVLKRIVTTYGTVRPDMGPNCPERIDWEFLRWVWNFNKNKRQRNYSLLEQYPDKEIHIFRNRRQLRQFLKTL
jgi:adenylate kinase family enzyme